MANKMKKKDISLSIRSHAFLQLTLTRFIFIFYKWTVKTQNVMNFFPIFSLLLLTPPNTQFVGGGMRNYYRFFYGNIFYATYQLNLFLLLFCVYTFRWCTIILVYGVCEHWPRTIVSFNVIFIWNLFKENLQQLLKFINSKLKSFWWLENF